MISDLKIKNFKCYTDKNICLNRLTILSGSNASGKSSIIQSLLLLKRAYTNADKRQLETNDIFGLNLGLPENIIAKEHDENKMFISCCINKKYSHEVHLELFEKETNPLSFNISNYDEILNDNYKIEFDKVLFSYINAERIGPRVTSPISENNDLYVGSKGEYTNYIMSKIDRMQKVKEYYVLQDNLNISKIKRFSANCQEWLNFIIPDTEFEIAPLPEYGISSILYKNSGDYYIPTATGFGITYVLPIIVQALVNSFYNDSIIIVENPEAHLHPFSQSQIGRFLALIASCGVQVIIETHSEHVINGSRLQMAENNRTDDMEIIFFERKNKRYFHKNISVNHFGELNEWPTGFFDQSKNDLKKLMEKRICGK